jgi:hypothetical protein
MPREIKSLMKPGKAKLKAAVKKVAEYAGQMPEGKSYKSSTSTPKPGRKVVKTKGMASRTVDGKDVMVKEKTKTVTKGGLTKKTVVKGKGMAGSGIGKYKEVKRFK